MTIDLSVPGALTTQSVRDLIASGDDSQNTQIRVSKAGVAYVTHDRSADPCMLFRLETLQSGNGYVGADASTDDAWVRYVHGALSENWPHPQSAVMDW